MNNKEWKNRIAEQDDLCVGIDLGTTNSVLAVINQKPNKDLVSKVVGIPRATDITYAVSSETRLTTERKATLPSCVYYREERNYETVVGDFAKKQYSLRPHLVAKSIKSQMGKAEAEGLSPDIPDKTPAQIAARILEHMLKNVSKIYKHEITDAVITVPANFDSSMCKATKDAARLAGIQVMNQDGSERPVLLSEPNAVIYDLINQIQNGEIPDCILDLSQKKNVMVFDLGGGTLDITLHEIKRREERPEILKVDEIATNRYTLLGGDDFDEELARAMYTRYIRQYADHPEAVEAIQKRQKEILRQLQVYAEYLKLELNERCSEEYSSGWDDEEEENWISVGGNMGGIGYSYDDQFSREEVEAVFEPFMARRLIFADYKKIEQISDTRNIIYPILDVLKKAADKLGREVIVDAVVLNGGMSKFYMVQNRLRQFFGFDPIVALDPDQAVARGAAVYHYYLHQYEELQEDMRLDGMAEGEGMAEMPKRPEPAIEWGSNILNDSLYLGAKNGAVSMIIPTGAVLPYTSKRMTGFQIEPGQNQIAIPIKSQNLDGSYRMITRGNIRFGKNYPNGAFVAFTVQMGKSKIITMNAWTSRDEQGLEKIEEGFIELAVGEERETTSKTKFVAPKGTELKPKEEINTLLQLFRNLEKSKSRQEKSNISKRIKANVGSICSAGNKEDFAEPILEKLGEIREEEARMRFFTIARRLGAAWSAAEKRKLARLCIDQLSMELNGMSDNGPKVSTNNQAIYALGICGEERDWKRLYVLHDRSCYLQACLYAHARSKTALDWLLAEFQKDIRQAEQGRSSNLQFSAYAVGIALRREEGAPVVEKKTEEDVVKKLTAAIQRGNLGKEELICSLLALGWICDQRQEESRLPASLLQEVLETVRDVGYYAKGFLEQDARKVQEVVEKLINGEHLDEEEEQFLLTKLEG